MAQIGWSATIARLAIAAVCVLMGAGRTGAQEPRPRAKLMHGSHPVDCLTFSRDGSTLASYSLEDSELKIWNVGSRKIAAKRTDVKLGLTREPGQPTLPIHSFNESMSFAHLILSPNGKLAAWHPASRENSECIKLWAPPKDEISDVSVPKRFQARSQTFSPNGKLLAVGCDKKAVVLWDVQKGKVAGILRHGRPEESTVDAIAFSPDGKTIAAGRSGNEIDLWNLSTEEIDKTLVGHLTDDEDDETNVQIVVFSPDGKTLATVAKGNIKVWDLAVGKSFTTINNEPGGAIFFAAFAADNRTLVVDRGRRSVSLWDTNKSKRVAKLEDLHGIPSLTADGEILATGDEKGGIQLWDLPGGRKRN